MNPGLAQSFVKLESLACRILRAYHEYGDMSHTDLVRTIDVDPCHVSTIVGRLNKLGYIFRQDRASKYDTEFTKTEWIYGLKPATSRHYSVRKRTCAERQARYRAKLIRQRSNSIFNLGATQLRIQIRAPRQMETEGS